MQKLTSRRTAQVLILAFDPVVLGSGHYLWVVGASANRGGINFSASKLRGGAKFQCVVVEAGGQILSACDFRTTAKQT